jgi:PKD repeat protein
MGILAGVVSAGCMKKQEAPPLTGPSEFGTSIGVTITPDVITQDGASQSVITVTARDTAGQPVRNVAIRLETLVDGALVDFGSLSARTVVTGNDGRATATYTAPASSSNGTDRLVTIAATPIGSDFGNATPRTATIRLVPQGVVNPPAGLVPLFISSPSAPIEDTPVLFDASGSSANTAITSYTWAFGNGRTGSGVTATTTYDDPGSYFVTLTIRDEFGRSASTTNTVTVGAGTRPTAAFTVSPTNPRTGDLVNFNAAPSTVPSGRSIVSYVWDFGDSTAFGSGPTPSHTYTFPRTYTVVLTVTDNTGQSATTSVTLTVAAAIAN